MIGNSEEQDGGEEIHWGNAWRNSVYDITDYVHSTDC